MTQDRYPYKTLFKKYVFDLCEPDEDGWAAGTCPFCGDPGTFRVNLKSGRWVCLPAPAPRPPGFERVREILPDVIRDIATAHTKHPDRKSNTTS